VLNARHLLTLGLFRSASHVNDWLRKGVESGLLRFYTRYRIREREKQCKPEYWYSSSDVRFKRDNNRHEVYLTEFLSLYWLFSPQVWRGPDVDQALLADAELTIGGTRYLIELDTGTMTHKQLKGRFKTLSKSPDTVLFVTLGRDRRLNGVLRTAAGFEGLNLVATTFAAVYTQPFGRVWHQPGSAELRKVDLPADLPTDCTFRNFLCLSG